MIRSIFGRLLLSHIAVILLTTVLLGVLMSYLLRGYVVESKKRDLYDKGYAVATMVAPILSSGRLPYRLELLGDLVGAQLWVANQEGTVIAGDPPPRWSGRFPGNASQIDALFAGKPQSWIRDARNQTDPSIIVAVPISSAAAPTAVFLYTPLTGINLAIRSLDRILLISILFGTIAAITMGFFISRGLTRPIADISKAAGRFAAGDYQSRSAAVGEDEIGRLAQVFNRMAEALAQIEQNRRDFLANVSHELKTPVAAIQALTEALQDGLVPDPDKQKRYLSTIVGEAGHIDRLVRDLLDLSQLEAGELTILKEKISLADFLPTELAKYDYMLAPKGLSLRADIPPVLPPVTADPMRLSQVMANLISNAVRYSPDGGTIEITAKTVAGKVMITVADNGPGIPRSDQPHIWDRFYRVDKSRSRQYGGTGLGLAITKHLVQAMGGEISLHSIPGEGATFALSLPIDPAKS
ncbi:MAG TPA: HAMP domain-containing sensor histidine kinase [Selenomonadales bacterium]|nr:HAMP domain-containing sensor histidine kinase [Selenomonadales bacterium]